MTIAVLGTGRLGLRVVRELISEGQDLRAATSHSERTEVLRELGVEVFPRQPGPSFFEGAELVIYCGPSEGVEGFLGQVAGRLVLTSSTGVYDGNRGEITEASPCGSTPRAQRLVAMEDLARAQLGEKLTVVRCSGLYSKGRGPFHVNARRLEQGERLKGSGEKFLNLIHDLDAARLITWAALNASAPPLLIGADHEPATRAVQYGQYCRVHGWPKPHFASSEPMGVLLRPTLRPTTLRYPSLTTALEADAA